MTVDKEPMGPEAIRQERIHESNVDEALAAGAEKAAEIIEQRARELEQAKEAITERDKRIEELSSRDSEIHEVVSDGSGARSARISRKQKALDALKKAGVITGAVLALLVAGAALEPYFQHRFGSDAPTQVARGDAPPAGFTRSLT